MDEKLEHFVALLHRPGVSPPRPMARPGPPVPAAARLLKPRRRRRAAWRWPNLALPTPSPRLWVNLGCGAAALGVIAVATWLALPGPTPQPLVAVKSSIPVPLPPPTPAPALARITLPIPAAAPPEQGETQAPAHPEATEPPPAPPAAKLAALPPPVAPGARVAALTPPATPPERRGEPAWLRYAVAVPPAAGRPEIAIVLDDVGTDRKGAERAVTVQGPLTLSFMTYADDLPRLTAAAHRIGDELMLHVPMQPLSASEDMGPNGLSVDLSRDEVLRRLRWDLSRFDGYVGINNHMGSRFTADPEGMTWVLEELKARGLLFLDSRTSAKSVGYALAGKLGVPRAGRDVFLDDVLKPEAIAARLAETEKIARQRGSVIAIGHPHEVTLDVLIPWLAKVKAEGFELVPVSTIVRQHMQSAGGTG